MTTSSGLRAPGAILFISCYESGHQPIAVASPCALLRRAGFDPAALDLSQAPLDLEAVRRARLVAISVPMHTALRLGVRAAERVRAIHPAARIGFYGLYATLNERILFARGADFIVGGEAEEPLLRLAEAIDARAADAGAGGDGARGDGAGGDRAAAGDAPIPGVGVPGRPAAPWIARPPLLPPARDLFPPIERYVHLAAGGERRVAGQVEASRGCRHLCRHCPIPPVYGGRFFVVPRDLVLEDVRRQVEAGATHITFADADFLNGPGHALKVAREMHARWPDLTFDFTAKVEHLRRHRALLPDLVRLGCLFVVTAVESLDDAVLAIFDKGHTRADVLALLEDARGAGLTIRPTFVPFTPWAGLDSYRGLVDFLWEQDLAGAVDPVQLSLRLLVPPGSLLESRPEFVPHRGAFDEERFTWTWSHPDPSVDRLQVEIARIVERAALTGADPAETHERIAAAAGATAATRPGSSPAREAPRLTEPWFC